MTLEDKKAQVYRLVRSGMDKERAELLAEMTLEEQELLVTDRAYQARCSIQSAIEERDLLAKLDDIIEQNAFEGKSSEIRWKLERLNPHRWGRAINIDMPPPKGDADGVPDLSRLDAKERVVLLSAITKTLSGEQD